MTIRTRLIRIGDRVLHDAEAGTAAPAPAHILGNTAQTLLSAEAGLVQHFESRNAGVEISWVLERRPAQTGDLEVELELRGLRCMQGTDDGVRLVDARGKPAVRVGHATAVDSAGRRQAVRAEGDAAGIVRYRLPSESLANAKYPLALDPLISADFVVFTPTPPTVGYSSDLDPDVAWGKTNWLVVWRRNSDYSVHATRVDAAGNTLDPGGIAVCTNGHQLNMPRASWAGTNWLVVWEDEAGGTFKGIFGGRVSADGKLPDGSGFEISSVSYVHERHNPEVCGGSNGWLVVWEYQPDVNQGRIMGNGVRFDRSLVGEFTVSDANDDQFRPRASWGTNSWLVVWYDNRSFSYPSDIYGRRVSAWWTTLDGNGFEICGASGSEIRPSVAWGGQNWLVVWETDFDHNIYGGRVQPAGTLLDGAGFAVNTGSGSQIRPSVDWGGQDWLVAWQDDRGTANNYVYGSRVAQSGTVRDPAGVGIATRSTPQYGPAVAYNNGGQALVVWSGQHLTTNRVMGALWTDEILVMSVLGTNGSAIASGETASASKGSDFGRVHLGLSVTNRFAITNQGNATVTISSSSFSGGGAGAYQTLGMPAGVAAGAVSNFSIVFAPTASGGLPATLAIGNDSDTDPFEVPVAGAGTNRSPTAVNDSKTMPEDTTAVLNVLTNDTDPDGDALTVVSVTDPPHGWAYINPGATNVAYTPDPDYAGGDSFQYVVQDPGGLVATGTVSVTVTAVNDEPSFNAGASEVVDESCGPQTVAGWATGIDDGDPEVNQTLTFLVSNDSAWLFSAQPAVSTNGTLTYTPAASSNGSALVWVQLADDTTAGGGALTSGVQTFWITVNAVNFPPVAVDDEATCWEDDWVSIPVVANDTDPDDDPLGLAAVGAAAHGTAFNNGGNHAGYQPAGDWHGTDTFDYVVSDGFGGLATGTVTVVVSNVNDAPVLNGGANTNVTMTEDGVPTAFALTLAATDVDGDTLTWSIASQGTLGTAGASGTGASKAISYVPAANANGADAFQVQVADGNGGVDTIWVNVTIDPVNDAPSFTKGPDQAVDEDQGPQVVVGWATGISDGDPEAGQTLTFIVSNSAPALFSSQPAVDASGTLAYTPAANASGVATCSVALADDTTAGGGAITTGVQTFTITISGVNDPPVAVADGAVTTQNVTVVIAVLANDADPDGDPLQVAGIVSQGANGTAAVGLGGTNVTYAPGADWWGADAFEYLLTDGEGGWATGQVTVTVLEGAALPIEAWVAITNAQPEAGGSVEVFVSARTGAVYRLLGADETLDGPWETLVVVTNPPGDGFSYTDPDVVGSVRVRFYQAVREVSGLQTTNPAVWAAYVQGLETGKWYVLAMPVNCGSNRLDGTLGEELGRGLKGDNVNGDLLYRLGTDGVWRVYMLNGARQWTTNDAATGEALDLSLGYWIKRRSGGVTTNAVYTGPVHTNAGWVVFRSNDWTIVARPWSRPRREDRAPYGWGFAAAGARGGGNWLAGDRLVAGTGTNAVFYWLNTDGRWYAVSTGRSASNVVLRAGEGYYYYHSGPGFMWRAEE